MYLLPFSKNSSCSACGHPLQDLTHLLFDCPASELLRRAIFGNTSSIFDLWSRPWGVVRLLEFLHAPIPRKGSDSTTITTLLYDSVSIQFQWNKIYLETHSTYRAEARIHFPFQRSYNGVNAPYHNDTVK